MSGEITLRDLQARDAAAVGILIGKVFAEYGMTFELGGWDKDLESPHSHYRGTNFMFQVAERDGVLVGTVAAHLVADAAELHRLYLAKEVRGQGLGTRLCDAAESWALNAGAKRMELWSDVRLVHGHALYRRRGYQIFASRILGDPDKSVEFGMRRLLATPPQPAQDPLTQPLTENLACALPPLSGSSWKCLSPAPAPRR
ncbi:MAG: GNAT family N-acetyltransferase [Deltaproteobacteria bacterium]|nr:GNAT family N-acetyltransferase [Deltaproteobacteria bacterium]